MMKKLAIILLLGLLHSPVIYSVEVAGKVDAYSFEESYIVINGSRYQLAEGIEIELPYDSRLDGLFVGAVVRIEFSNAKVHRIYIDQ